MTAGYCSIMIGICTYRRPDGLAQTLASLDALDVREIAGIPVSVLVVDNAPEAGAEAVVAQWANTHRFPTAVDHEPKKGLSAARNRILAQARSSGAAYLAFIDDDEMATPGWLAALYHRACETGAGAVIGPVAPVFVEAPARHVPAECYQTRLPTSDGFVTDGYTSNALIDLEAVRFLDLTFDPDLDQTGGEDTMFFKAMVDGGLAIAWAADAMVQETIPPSRATATWLWRRWYRTGMVEGRLVARSFRPGSVSARLKNLALGLARVGLGAGRLFASLLVSSWRQPQRTVKCAYTLCRGVGQVAFALGHSYNAYDRRNYR